MVPLWPLLLPGPLHRDSFSTDCLETWGCSRVRLCFSFLVYSYLSHLTASPWARNDVLWQLRFPGASHTVESTILAHSCCCWAGHGGGGNTKGHQLWLSVHLAQRPNDLLEATFPSHSWSGSHFARYCWEMRSAEKQEKNLFVALLSHQYLPNMCGKPFLLPWRRKVQEEIWVLTQQSCFVFEGSACPWGFHCFKTKWGL